MLCRAISVYAQKLDPRIEWHTLETAHFSLHYPIAAEPIAEKMAGVVEQVHRDITAKLGWATSGKTEVILSDMYDEANGMATALPYKIVILYLAPPYAGDEISEVVTPLRDIFYHEYTHIIQMEIRHGLPLLISRILGRFPLLFPNTVFQVPAFMEGIAVYDETLYSSGGRNRSAYYDMVLRSVPWRTSCLLWTRSAI